jgi:DNA gyrase/topoisomerase IV subunit B
LPGCDRSCAKRRFQACGEFQLGILLSVTLSDMTETENIFSTLMGEDVEARRKFIEDNALDVKNLDI